MKRIHLLWHCFLPHLKLRTDFCFSLCRWNRIFNDWECICHNHICSERCGLLWVSSFSSSCNRILDLIHNLSLILMSSVSSSATWFSSRVTVGGISNDTELTGVCGVASLFNCCDTFVVLLLSTCWESVAFIIEASSNVTYIQDLFIVFLSHIFSHLTLLLKFKNSPFFALGSNFSSLMW